MFALLLLLAAALPPIYDEVQYYLPALAAVRADPPPAIGEYPFPGPPFALWIQSLTWEVCGRTTFGARLFSLLSWACLASLPLWRSARRGPIGQPYGHWYTVAFPFILFAAVSSKHHVFVLLMILIAVATHEEARQRRRGGLWLSIAACASAAGTSQLAGPACLALAADAIVRKAGPSGIWRQLAGPAVGLAVLAAFVILWGGTSPPSFVDVPAFPDRESANAAAGLRWRPQQLALGVAMLGVWATPWIGVSRRSLWIAAACLLPGILLVDVSGLLHESDLPSSGGRGPVCSALRSLSTISHPIVGPAVLGTCAALGAAGLVDRSLRSPSGRLCTFYVALYLAMMMAVPFVFESYYVLMVIPACHLLGLDDVAELPHPALRALRWWVPVAGVVYLLAKALQRIAAS